MLPRYLRYSVTRLTCSIVLGLILALTNGRATLAGDLEQASESAFQSVGLKQFSPAGPGWNIADNLLVGSSNEKPAGSTSTCTLKTKLLDFELRLQFRLKQGRASIGYRSQNNNESGYRLLLTADENCGTLLTLNSRQVLCETGHNIQLGPKGTTIESSQLSKPNFANTSDEQWHDLVIIAQHERLIHKIDGRFVIDATDHRNGRPDSAGKFLMQLDSATPTELEIRHVRVRKLPRATPNKPIGPRIAAVVSEYRHNSHADVIVSRLIETDLLNNHGQYPNLQLVSIFTDQVPGNDTSRTLAKQAGVPVCSTIEEALTLGTGKLAVNGVLLVAEHGDYPLSDTGNRQYPKRRLFAEVVRVFEKTGGVVPVFIDKHLADNWEDANWVYQEGQRLNIPMMAGSSLPGLWRFPAVDVTKNAQVKEVVATTYGSLDAYGFHALEMVQCLVEQRQGGETGIVSAQCFSGDAVWTAMREGIFDRKLLNAALSRAVKSTPPLDDTLIEKVSRPPDLFVVRYRDGLQVSILSLPSAINEWTVAWREDDRPEIKSTVFWTQEARPFYHFQILLNGCQTMFKTKQAAWPIERTLLTSGVLDALLISKRDDSRRVETPWLDVQYQSQWRWQEPLAPPPSRPVSSQ